MRSGCLLSQPVEAHGVVVQHAMLIGFGIFGEHRAICAKKIGIARVQLLQREIAAIDSAPDTENLDRVANDLAQLRYGDAERLSRLEIDHKLELVG